MNKTVYLYICHGVLFIIGYLMREWAFPVVTLKRLNKPIMEHTAYKLFLLFCCIFVQIKSEKSSQRQILNFCFTLIMSVLCSSVNA